MAVSPEGRRRCGWCGHLLRRAARIDARFCSDRCRAASNRRLARDVAAYAAMVEYQDRCRRDDLTLRCPGCGAPVAPFLLGHPEQAEARYRADRRYCSAICRTRAWRSRQRSSKPNAQPSRRDG